MLKQILEAMYVDAEMLELMSEDQQQLLFRKIREEQLRRWQLREKEEERKKKKSQPKRTPRKIQFLLGRDGQPWTWVMGEHENDLSYEELVQRRERREMEKEEEEEWNIRQEAEEVAKNETSHILSLASRFGELRPRSPSPSPTLHKRWSVDTGQPTGPSPKTPVRRLVSDSGNPRHSLSGPLLTVPESLSSSSSMMPRTESQLDLSAGSSEHVDDSDTSRDRRQSKEKSLRRSALTNQVPIIGKTSEEQQQFQARRAEEIFVNMKEVKQLARKKSMEVSQRVEERWKESEQKAKAFELTRKASFNKARQLSRKSKIDERQILEGIPEHKKKELEMMLDRSKPSPARQIRPARPAPIKTLVRQSSIMLPGTRPKTQNHVVTWFRENEAPRGRCKEKDGSISLWFHGRISRDRAESLLEKKVVGSYLVRLSAKIWGYTISVKTYTEVKHFLVDVSSGQCQFLGPKQTQFRSLQELTKFYRVNPITAVGQEVLLVPVAQLEPEDSRNFLGLFREADSAETHSTYL